MRAEPEGWAEAGADLSSLTVRLSHFHEHNFEYLMYIVNMESDAFFFHSNNIQGMRAGADLSSLTVRLPHCHEVLLINLIRGVYC